MISGTVTPKGRAIVRLPIQGPGGGPQVMDASIDTAYNGFLALPARLIATLRLSYTGSKKSTLADGREVMVRHFRANVQWHGRPLEVDIAEVRGGALIGMSLLQGSRLTVDVVVNGRVSIEPLA